MVVWRAKRREPVTFMEQNTIRSHVHYSASRLTPPHEYILLMAPGSLNKWSIIKAACLVSTSSPKVSTSLIRFQWLRLVLSAGFPSECTYPNKEKYHSKIASHGRCEANGASKFISRQCGLFYANARCGQLDSYCCSTVHSNKLPSETGACIAQPYLDGRWAVETQKVESSDIP